MESLGQDDASLLERILLEHPKRVTIRIVRAPIPGASRLADGAYFPLQGEVYVRGDIPDPALTLVHELGHVAQDMAGKLRQVPPGMRRLHPRHEENFPQWLARGHPRYIDHEGAFSHALTDWFGALPGMR
jgi:hypothetical protein